MLSTKLKEAAGNSADATLYVDDVFSTYLYTGNGSTQTITNGIDLAGKGGLVWTKVRDSTDSHNLQDTTRGAGLALSSNSLNAQVTQSNSITSFTSTGYVLGADTNEQVNYSNRKYVSWTFREAAKFFDIVTYTGTGSARTIAHNLGSVPGCIIVKTLSTSNQWSVYHRSLGASQAIMLQSTNAAFSDTIWNNTTPTSTVFSLNSQSDVNASGVTYVAYLFAHDTAADGIIQCGSYTEGSAPVSVSLGWEPQWLLIKSSSISANWHLFDVMRGMSNTQQSYLYPNLSNAEGSQAAYFIPTATGFTAVNDYFGSGTSVIYMAIRMPNKPPTSGTQVYNGIARDGTGSPTTITGVGFPPDWVHAKSRTLTKNNLVIDRLRGGAKNLLTDDTTSEQTSQTATAFNQDGITVGADAEYAGINAVSGYPYINHFFKRAPGFFDEVCYTGTGSTLNPSHNLGVIPELKIIKCRSSVVFWVVGGSIVTGGTQNDYIVLNDTAAKVISSTYWTSGADTSTTFSTRTGNGASNDTSQTFVAYLFATLAGIQYINSYVGDGTTGRVINCGFSAGARFICIKATSTTGSWWVWDSARGITSTNDPALQLNSTAAEITSADAIDPSSSGFIVNQEATCSINASGVSYLVWAIA